MAKYVGDSSKLEGDLNFAFDQWEAFVTSKIQQRIYNYLLTEIIIKRIIWHQRREH
jgi:hypothetical protein